MLQSNQVLSFFRACERGDWSQPELAEFYRVEDALTKSGVGISAERGITDEGEPWFVFFRQDNEEVIVHFARIGGEYVVASNFTEAVFRGRNFQTLVRELLDSHPYVVLPKQHSTRSTVFLHPAALLAALVVTCYVKSSELNATADDGSRPEKSLGWFLNLHDLAATYSAIIIAAVWDSLAIDSSVSKPFDDLASLDHAQPAHGEHGIEQAVADDSPLQDFQVFHSTNDRSVLTAAMLDLDGQDAVHEVKEPAIAALVTNPSSLHPESSHYDNAAAFSACDVFRAENDLDSKLADFRLQHDASFPIAAKEQVELTVTYTSSLSNLKPDHSTPQHVSTTPTTAIEHSDTTIAPDNHSSALHVEDTVNPSIPNVTSLSDVMQAPVSDLQPDSPSIPNVTSLSDVMQAPVSDLQLDNPSISNGTSLSDAMQAPVSDLQPEVTSTSEPTAQVNQVTSTSEPTAQVNQVTSTSEPTAQVNQVTSTGEPAQVNYAALPSGVTADTVEAGTSVSIVGIDMHHTATTLA